VKCIMGRQTGDELKMGVRPLIHTCVAINRLCGVVCIETKKLYVYMYKKKAMDEMYMQ
jgi:hypothetical protein